MISMHFCNSTEGIKVETVSFISQHDESSDMYFYSLKHINNLVLNLLFYLQLIKKTDIVLY